MYRIIYTNATGEKKRKDERSALTMQGEKEKTDRKVFSLSVQEEERTTDAAACMTWGGGGKKQMGTSTYLGRLPHPLYRGKDGGEERGK